MNTCQSVFIPALLWLGVLSPLQAAPMVKERLSPGCFHHLLRATQAQVPMSPFVDQVLSRLNYLPKVIEYDRSQPEFSTTFNDYLKRRVSAARIEKGNAFLHQHQHLLRGLTQQYGVPGRYLIAFWGLETNFGAYMGKMPTLDSLATLACDNRRQDFFTAQFTQAIQLMLRDRLDPQQMQGSWAGAMGHTQFMPETALKYARDGDGDGQVNLWESEADALTSSAFYLQQMGWKAGEKWGREVLLPSGFDYAAALRTPQQSLQAWHQAGITTTHHSALPALDMQARLILPAGHQGPAFLVYNNFDIILRWNRSDYYALSVGLLADRIAGYPPLKVQPPEQTPLDRYTVVRLQQSLTQRGFDPGPADGIMGSQTRQALQAFQVSQHLVADGFPSQQTLEKLFQ